MDTGQPPGAKGGVTLWPFLLACTTSEPTPDPFTPTLPVSHCGMADYALVPLAGLGEPVDHEVVSGFDLTSTAVDSLLTLLELEALSPVPHGAVVYRFRYTTQDRGAATEATGLIAVPQGGAPDGDAWPVAVLLHGFAGTFDACAPSATPLIGPGLAAVLASQGYAVIAPDYLGMTGLGEPSPEPHAPLIGEPVAIASWDAWRAGTALLGGDLAYELDHPLREDLLIWGASQGGHAALFMDLAAPHYAPEAQVVGVVASTAAADLRAVVQDGVTTWSDASGLSALSLGAMWTWYGVPDGLETLLTNEEPYYFADALAELLTEEPDSCEPEDVELDVDEVADIYHPDFIAAAAVGDWEAVDPWGCFITENSLESTSIPRLDQVPTLLIYGEEDTLVQPELQGPGLDRLCADGWEAETLHCQGAPHPEATLWSLPEQLAWMEARLAGEPWTPSCALPEPDRCAGTPEDER